MPWSTTRTMNKGPGRHVLRLILLVVLAWTVIYHLNYNQTPKPETLTNLLPSEDGQWRRPVRPPPKTNTDTKSESPQVNIAAAGPQVGQASFDIDVEKDQVAASTQQQEPDIPAVNPAPSASSPTEAWTKTHYDAPGEPIRHVVLSRNVPHAEPPSLLILVMTRDAASWGRDNEQRTFKSFLNLLSTSGLDLTTCALGLLTSSEDEFRDYESVLDADAEKFGAASLILHPGYAGRENADGEDGRVHRHDSDVQHARRAEMARLRNYLMLSALPLTPTAAEILWLDSDVYEVTEGLFDDMREGMRDNRVGVVTAVSIFGGGDWGDYDLNAWRGERTKPNEEERERLREELGSWTANPVGDGKSEHMGNIIQRLDREEWERKVEAGEIDADSLEKYGQWDPKTLVMEEAEEKRKQEEEQQQKENEKEEGDGTGDGAGDGEGEEEGENQDGEENRGEEDGQEQNDGGDDENDNGDSGEGDDGTKEKRQEGEEEKTTTTTKKTTKTNKTNKTTKQKPKQDQKPKNNKTKNKNNNETKPKNKKAHEEIEVEGFFRLDSVGGTVLMLKAGVVRQGLTFATSYLVGTDWQSEGWDGVETEGLCVTARTLGTGCWGIRKGHSHHCVG